MLWRALNPLWWFFGDRERWPDGTRGYCECLGPLHPKRCRLCYPGFGLSNIVYHLRTGGKA